MAGPQESSGCGASSLATRGLSQSERATSASDRRRIAFCPLASEITQYRLCCFLLISAPEFEGEGRGHIFLTGKGKVWAACVSINIATDILGACSLVP